MSVVFFNVTDVKQNWKKVVDATKTSKVMILQRSKVAFELVPVEQKKGVGYQLTEKTMKRVTKSMKELSTGKYIKGSSKEIMRWLES
jgi:hypothetical protein